MLDDAHREKMLALQEQATQKAQEESDAAKLTATLVAVSMFMKDDKKNKEKK